MTEAEWNGCCDPRPMLEFLGKASKRKLCLFSCGCCHFLVRLQLDARCSNELQIMKRLADGLANEAEMNIAFDGAIAATEGSQWGPIYEDSCQRAMAYLSQQRWLDVMTVTQNLRAEVMAYHQQNSWPITLQRATANEKEFQAMLVREIFGNPFRFPELDQSWLTRAVMGLAETIYQEETFDEIPILADALEDAGCTNADILNHCRQPGEHVRGCWVIDLLTGRT